MEELVWLTSFVLEGVSSHLSNDHISITRLNEGVKYDLDY